MQQPFRTGGGGVVTQNTRLATSLDWSPASINLHPRVAVSLGAGAT
jgi:hypothetical protein